MPRIVGDWTLDKLKIIESYLPAYLSATQTTVEQIYIDGFAGPGQNQLRGSGKIVDGSPMLALDAHAPSGNRFDKLYFIEKDKAASDELQQLVKDRDMAHRSTVIPGDVNAELPRTVHRFNQESPIFVLLDTEGIDPEWRTIEEIADWRTELLINFPLGMAINRNPDSEKVDKYFGTDAWRPIWSAGPSLRASRLLSLYRDRLANLGYKYQVEDPRLVKGEGNRRLYYLIFASKRPVARRIMRWVFKQPDAAGQSRFDLEFDA